MSVIKEKIKTLLQSAGITGEIELSKPPKAEMGDFAFACFALAKEQGKNPAEVAAAIAAAVDSQRSTDNLVHSVKPFGPYVNFFLDGAVVAKEVLAAVTNDFGSHKFGKDKLYLVEFACPNPFKAFHLGHLKNLITGEAVVRTMENAGYTIKRVNYQGDVGMHVAKAMWGIYDWIDQFESMKQAPLKERVEFLGKAYAHGAQRFEESEEGKQEVIAYNDKVYNATSDIQDVYVQARTWSLEYFDGIYQRMGSHFDRLYLESEVFEKGLHFAQEATKQGVLKKSEGAVIFPGSEHGLHDRVFINSKGFPTYDAKELGLAEMHFEDHHPDKVIHVVGKDQTEYFKVAFKALELVHPETTGKEYHLPGGFLQLAGDKKMSSRTGNIVTGDQLIAQVTERVAKQMEESQAKDKVHVLEKVTVAALKYAMLKADVSKDVIFDMEASISTQGESGPYLLYMVSRMNSILEKYEGRRTISIMPSALHDDEKALALLLADFPTVTAIAAHEPYDPSGIAKYCFDVAQQFSKFYNSCPVLQAEDENMQALRILLIEKTRMILQKGLQILGIDTVEKM